MNSIFLITAMDQLNGTIYHPIAFRTLVEAVDYCKVNDSRFLQHCYRKIHLGKMQADETRPKTPKKRGR